MKLLNRATIYYSLATLLSFIFMGAVIYNSIRHIVLQQVSEALLTEKQIIEEQILHTDTLPDFSDIFNHKIEVVLYKNRLRPAQGFVDTLINDPLSNSLVEYRFLKYAGNTADGRGFVIMTSQSIEEEKDLLYEIFTIIIIAFAALLLILIIIIYSISRGLWGSFYYTLHKIQTFDIKSESEFNPVKTRITEFAQLNQVLKVLTGKIKSDYVNLKEVTENVSHEIQTPLAVIRLKIEQMLQSDSISDQLAESLFYINQLVTKISRINQAVALMSKIENNQYSLTKTISVNRKIAELLTQFSDFIQSKHLEVRYDSTNEVELEMNTDLADCLFTNLLNNAIKHNINNGWITISLNHQELIIQNTGKDPNISTELLFQRFKKAELTSDSPGLGLAIVKNVTDIYAMTIKYNYTENIHTLHITF
jgi:signal transduction histidine kinase